MASTLTSGESTPLLSPNSKGESSSFYFIHQAKQGVVTTNGTFKDPDGGLVQEALPPGANPDEFAPRVLGAKSPKADRAPSGEATKSTSENGGNFFSNLFQKKKKDPVSGANQSLMKQRKAPIKVEPKVFFANERTFLAWLHISIILAGASIAILAFADENNPGSQLYGIVMLPVAIAFIVYSMYQYARRAYMIRNKHPGPYEDTVGPAVLGVILMLSIVCQFAIKLHSMTD